ncbi:MAG: MFS transporter [Spirochaetes bacterium]|nr:MFS transporter [Spirochaetota bacterium]MBU1079823.1 MFS transporter [Spirochaetota bacterium]
MRTRNCVAYGLGDLYGGGAFLLVSTFAMYYLVAVVGMSPILAGLIPGLGKIWDAVSDPLMGFISDRTKSRFGRRRVWFLVGIAPIFASVALIWVPVRASTDLGLFAYYFLAYVFFYTVSTMVLVPYGALSAEMASEFKDRNKLTGFRMFFSMLAALISGTVPQVLINAFPDPRAGHLAMGLVFGALFAAPWIVVYLGTWEGPVPERAPKAASGRSEGFVSNFATIFRNGSFRVHIAMYIFAYATMDVLMGWLKFYLADYLGRPGFLMVAMGAILVPQIAALPVYIAIANRKGHAFAYRIGLSIMLVAMAAMYLHTPETPVVFLVLNCVLAGLGQSAAVLVPFQLLPFVVDVDELITGKKRAGTYAGAMTLIRKLIQGALVLPVLGVILAAIGYLGPVPARLSADDMSGVIVPRVAAAAPADASALARAYADDGSGQLVLDPRLTDDDRRAVRRALDAAGYKGSGASRTTVSVVQPDGTAGKIRALFAFLPLALLALGIISSLRMRLGPANHRTMKAEIDRLNAGGLKADASAEARRVCELLAGMPYDSLRPAGR